MGIIIIYCRQRGCLCVYLLCTFLYYILTLIIFTEDSEGLLELVLGVRVADLLVHQVAELGELHKPGPVDINLHMWCVLFAKCKNINKKPSTRRYSSSPIFVSNNVWHMVAIYWIFYIPCFETYINISEHNTDREWKHQESDIFTI